MGYASGSSSGLRSPIFYLPGFRLDCDQLESTIMLGVPKYFGLKGNALSLAISWIAGLDFLYGPLSMNPGTKLIGRPVSLDTIKA